MRPSIKQQKLKFLINSTLDTASSLFQDSNPRQTIASGRLMVQTWLDTLEPERRQNAGMSFMYRLIYKYWTSSHALSGSIRPIPAMFHTHDAEELDNLVLAVAEVMGKSAAGLDNIEANHLLGNLYSSMLSDIHRAQNGVYYTPAPLAQRMVDTAALAGVDYSTARVLDPACGAGAFLLPVLRKIRNAGKELHSSDLLWHIQRSVLGLEIDPFSAWLCQIFVEIELKDLILETKNAITPLVRVVNSLEIITDTQERFDLVIGNPPYGKLKLNDFLRTRFGESLYGHPNLYGLFTHLAVDLAAKNGVISFLTPTSFLSGEYFKNLRNFLRLNVTPHQLEFIKVRKGVFEDVLQETMLSTFKVGKSSNEMVNVNEILAKGPDGFEAENSGKYSLPTLLKAPWILPRNQQQARFVSGMLRMRHNLESWGYKISTGPLVWNRHKSQLTTKRLNSHPIIWAESISADGTFKLQSEKKNHLPFLHTRMQDQWLVIRNSCVLLQRTTAKEQRKRLICAVLPTSLIDAYDGVVVENHLNMILPACHPPRVNLETLSVFLNSAAVNECFRTISGSVAVSAYELESLPLPNPEKLERLADLVSKGATTLFEEECLNIYLSYQ